MLLLTSDVELSVFVVLSIISVLLDVELLTFVLLISVLFVMLVVELSTSVLLVISDVELLIFLLSSTLVGSLIESLPLKKSSHKSLIKSNILSINELLSLCIFYYQIR